MRGSRRLAVPALMLTSAAALLLPGSAAASVTVFSSTSAEQQYTVPAGVTSIHVVAIGGAGDSTANAAGGRGAQVTADVPVTAGEVLYVEVGGSGASGGFNGGGAAGSGVQSGAAGGGASDIRTVSCGGACLSSAGSLSSRLLVAAGGGGAGYGAGTGGANAGGDPGMAGANSGDADPGLGGGAGTASAGGHGGAGGSVGPPCRSPEGSGTGGAAGTGGTGGTDSFGYGGGGGGGGFYGGGGGGGGGDTSNCGGGGGGGGGGSSFEIAGSQNISEALATPTTAPSITITATEVPLATVVTPQLRFAGMPVNQAGPAQIATIRNDGSATLLITGLSFGGNDPSDFALTAAPCLSMAPGASCDFQVRFAPGAAGARSATLTAQTNDHAGSVTVNLTGSGTAPAAVFCVVPRVIGLTPQRAAARLRRAGCAPGRTSVQGKHRKHAVLHVAGQLVPAGIFVRVGTKVGLILQASSASRDRH